MQIWLPDIKNNYKEQKGFYIIEFEFDYYKKNKKLHFIELPTRPMVDIELNSDTENQEIIKSELKLLSSGHSEDSIIRIACKSDKTRKVLNNQLLSSVFSPTVNIQFKGGWKRTN